MARVPGSRDGAGKGRGMPGGGGRNRNKIGRAHV